MTKPSVLWEDFQNMQMSWYLQVTHQTQTDATVMIYSFWEDVIVITSQMMSH